MAVLGVVSRRRNNREMRGGRRVRWVGDVRSLDERAFLSAKEIQEVRLGLELVCMLYVCHCVAEVCCV